MNKILFPPGTKDKITTFVCSLNIVLILFLYQSSICLVYPFWEEKLTMFPVTLIVRMISLAVCMLAFFLAAKEDRGTLNIALKWLIFFWVLYMIRNVYDLEFQTEYASDEIFNDDNRPYYPFAFRICGGKNFAEQHLELWLFLIPMTLFPTYTVFRTFRKIDLSLVLKISRYLLFFISFFALFNMHQIGIRMDMGDALNPISLGQFGVSMFLIGVAGKGGNMSKRDIFSFWLIIAGVIISFSSASRGAFFTLLYCSAVLFISAYPFASALSRAIIITIAFLLAKEPLLDMIGEIFPGTYQRVIMGIDNDYLGRGEIYWRFLEKTWQTSPFFGFQTDLFGYSHNSIIDGFMMFGFIFGWIVLILIALCFTKALVIFHRRKQCLWLFLIAVQYIFHGFSSGAFGNNQVLQPLLCLCFLTYAAIQPQKEANEIVNCTGGKESPRQEQSCRQTATANTTTQTSCTTHE